MVTELHRLHPVWQSAGGIAQGGGRCECCHRHRSNAVIITIPDAALLRVALAFGDRPLRWDGDLRLLRSVQDAQSRKPEIVIVARNFRGSPDREAAPGSALRKEVFQMRPARKRRAQR